jgi:nicotinamidase-related amidase
MSLISKTGDSLLKATDSALLLVDIQEKFRPVIQGMEELIARAEILVRGAVRLGIPVFATEQYPYALGETVPELKEWLPDNQEYSSKVCFSSFGCESFAKNLVASKRKQVVVVGIETHVCVMQTGLELLAGGYGVYVPTDAVSSRKDADREMGLRRLEKHGAELVTSEMVIFEWLRTAGTPEFKELQTLLK